MIRSWVTTAGLTLRPDELDVAALGATRFVLDKHQVWLMIIGRGVLIVPVFPRTTLFAGTCPVTKNVEQN